LGKILITYQKKKEKTGETFSMMEEITLAKEEGRGELILIKGTLSNLLA
jgi:hypothetical protein